MSATPHRFGTVLLCGLLAASPAYGESIAYETLDDRSKVAIETSCAGWVVRENPELVAFWMAAIEPLCSAAAAPQPDPGPPPVTPAQAQ